MGGFFLDSQGLQIGFIPSVFRLAVLLAMVSSCLVKAKIPAIEVVMPLSMGILSA